MNFLKLIADALTKYGIWPILLLIYKTSGRDGVKRAMTPRREWVEASCKAFGTDLEQALAERDEAIEQDLQFLEAIVDSDFIDPDPEPEEN